GGAGRIRPDPPDVRGGPRMAAAARPPAPSSAGPHPAGARRRGRAVATPGDADRTPDRRRRHPRAGRGRRPPAVDSRRPRPADRGRSTEPPFKLYIVLTPTGRTPMRVVLFAVPAVLALSACASATGPSHYETDLQR